MRRTRALLFLVSLLLGCGGNSLDSALSFRYSFWRTNNGGALVDIGCLEAGVARVHVALFSSGVNVGDGDSICDAFGNQDSQSAPSELGEFFDAGFRDVTFDELQISLLRQDGTLVPFGVRLDGADRSPADRQSVTLVAPTTLLPGQDVSISMPGEPNTQVAQEIQLILP